MHARDVVANMRDQGVESVNEFMWASQLRYELVGEGGADGYKPGDTLVKQLRRHALGLGVGVGVGLGVVTRDLDGCSSSSGGMRYCTRSVL